MKVAAIIDNDTAIGLRLSGVKELFVPNDNNAIHIWN